MRKFSSKSTLLLLTRACILIFSLNVSFLFPVVGQGKKFSHKVDTLEGVQSNETMYSSASQARDNGDYAQGLSILNHLLTTDQLNAEQKSKALRLQRNLYFDLESYSKAIEIHRTINWDALPNYWESLAPNHFIALVNYNTGNFTLALNDLKTSSEILSQEGYFKHSFHSYMLLSKSYQSLRELDSAQFYLGKAKLELNPTAPSDSMNHYTSEMRSLSASLLFDRGDYLKAIPLFKADTAFYLHTKEFTPKVNDGVSSTLKLAAALIEIDQFKLAKSTLRRAEQLLTHFPNPEQYQILLRYRIKYYENTNQLDSAYALTKGYVAMWDLLLQNRSQIKSQSQQIAFGAILEEERLSQAHIQSDVIAKGEEERARLLTVVALVILVGASIILMIYLFYRRLLKDKQKLTATSNQLEIKSSELETTLREKELLVKEVHHRVKNNLQMISSLFFIQSKNVSDPIAKSVINEGQARVQAMASIHQKLYDSDTIDNIDMKPHFDSLCHQIISSYAPAEKNIELDLDISDIRLNVDIALPLSLIINELISNSVKHAFKSENQGTIRISLASDAHSVHLKYEDSGTNFHHDTPTTGGIGLKLIKLLSSQLKANLEDDSKGGSFNMTIPLD